MAVYRIGAVGDPKSVVAVEAFSALAEEDVDGIVAAAVLFTPTMARKCAGWLIEFADQCDGTLVPFFPGSTEFKGA